MTTMDEGSADGRKRGRRIPEANPGFFEQYADLLAEIFVPHPHGGRAIPIAERQIVTLREKNAQLETKLQELIQFGSENDAISEKLHRSTLALFAASDLETTLGVLYHSLQDDFRVPQVALRLWGKVPEQSYLPELAATSQELREYAAGLGEPYCGTQAPFESRDWFDAHATLKSYAFLPLRTASHLRPARTRQRDAGTLLRRHGNHVPDAPGGARERGDRALPARRPDAMATARNAVATDGVARGRASPSGVRGTSRHAAGAHA